MKLLVMLVVLSGCANLRSRSILDPQAPDLTRREKERRSFIMCVQRFWDAGMTAAHATEVCNNSMAFPQE